MPEGSASARDHHPEARPPSYRIPEDDQVMDAVVQAVTEGRIGSQKQLADQALSILARTGEAYALSPARARKIASKERAIRIRVMTRKAQRAMLRCPFCDAALERDGATDIFGKTTTAGRVCPNGDFRMDPGKRGPARYVFELRW